LTEERWQADKLEGLTREFYPEGKLKVETMFLDGKKNGPFRSFGADGVLATSGEFRDDKLSGPLRLHYPDEKIFAECQYDGDRLVGGRLFYPDGKVLGQFGSVLGKSGKVCSLLLQYPDGKPLSSTRVDDVAGTITWQGWSPDGSLLGQVENLSTSSLPPSTDNPAFSGLVAWRNQQESLEHQIGLSFPPEFNLLPR
jgi:hypothetical protein